jgi:energy-coupling factor transport system permease protein
MTMLQYTEGNSFFHRMDPSIKFIWTFVISFLAFAVTDPFFLAILLMVQMFIIRLLAGIPFKSLGKRAWIAFGPALAFFIFYTFLYPNGKGVLLDLGLVKISLEGMMYGAAIGLRFPISVLMAIVFVITTEPRKFVYSLIQVLKVPAKYAYILMVSLRTFPLAEEEFHNIIDAQTIRGMDVHAKGVRKRMERLRLILIPLMARIFKNNLEQMAMAMDSRAFGAYENMTFIEECKPSKKDVAFLVLWIIIFIAIVATGIGNIAAYAYTYTPWKD